MNVLLISVCESEANEVISTLLVLAQLSSGDNWHVRLWNQAEE